MIDPDRSPTLAAAAALIDAAMRSAVRSASEADPEVGAAPVEPGLPVGSASDALPTGDDASTGEPWAEAFDFGRLVPVAEREIGGVVQPTVIARDVHAFLGSARWFSDWFVREAANRPLAHEIDYSEGYSHNNVGNSRGRPRREFFLTLKAAKKVAMAAGGRRGNAVQEHFIEQERRIVAGEPPIPGSVDPDLLAARLVEPAMPVGLAAMGMTQGTMPIKLSS